MTTTMSTLLKLTTRQAFHKQTTTQVLKSHSTQTTTPSPSTAKLQASQTHLARLVSQHDPTSHILSAYIPSPVRPYYIALKALGVELSKIYNNSASDLTKDRLGFSSAEFKLKTLQESVLSGIDSFSQINVKDPIAVMLQDCVTQGYNLNSELLEHIFQAKKYELTHPQYQTVTELCSHSESYNSQFNYLIQNLLLSPSLSPSTLALVEEIGEKGQTLLTEIMAHLGQGSGVASSLIGLSFFAKQGNRVTIPSDVLMKHGLSEESILRLFQLEERNLDTESKLKDVIYEMCILANDHHLTAQSKLSQLQSMTSQTISHTSDPLTLKHSKKWRRYLPDCLYVPMMTGLPLGWFLKELEKRDFDLKKVAKQGKLGTVWRSYWGFRGRKI